MTETTPTFESPPDVGAETRPDGHVVGMITFFVSEAAFFSTLLLAYVIYIGQSVAGPTPAVLSLPLTLASTLCLVLSSVTIHFAEKRLHAGCLCGFRFWWTLTIVLGALFLAGTAYEWHDLITRYHLTISRNLFGTTFYTVVGFHAAHVTAGLVMLLIMLKLVREGRETAVGVKLTSWYWHFVDGVWIVVFLIVYVLGR